MKSKKTLNLPQKGFKFVELHQTTAIYLFFALNQKNETNDIWAQLSRMKAKMLMGFSSMTHRSNVWYKFTSNDNVSRHPGDMPKLR